MAQLSGIQFIQVNGNTIILGIKCTSSSDLSECAVCANRGPYFEFTRFEGDPVFTLRGFKILYLLRLCFCNN